MLWTGLSECSAPWKTMAALLALSLVANWIGYDLGRESSFRQYAYQVPYAALQAMGAWLVWRSRRRLVSPIASCMESVILSA